MTRGFLLNTNVFNHLADLAINPAALAAKGRLFVTHVQLDERQATTRAERTKALLTAFERVEQERVPTAAAVWNVSKFNEAEWGDAGGRYGPMLASLNAKNGGKANNAQRDSNKNCGPSHTSESQTDNCPARCSHG